MAARKRKDDKRKADPVPTDPPAPPSPLIPMTTSQFDRDVDLMKRRGNDMPALRAVVDLIIQQRPLERRHRDHRRWVGCRECHVKDDWVIVYEIRGPEVYFHRTGTHTDMGW